MYQDVTKQAAQAMEELLAAAKLERGDPITKRSPPICHNT